MAKKLDDVYEAAMISLQNYELADAIDRIDFLFFGLTYMRPDADLSALLANYTRHVGIRKIHLAKMIRDRINELASLNSMIEADASVFDIHGRLHPAVAKRANIDPSIYYDPAGDDEVSHHLLLSSGPNEHLDRSFPERLRFCFEREERHALKLYSANGATLFAGASLFQVYDPARRLFWPTASPFALTDSIEHHDHEHLAGDIVYVGDIFSGTNFSHFLFDYVTRFAIAAEQADAANLHDATYIFSGVPGPFHQLVLAALCKRLSVPDKAIRFPIDGRNFTSNRRIHWFSDAFEHNQHPAQLMHPRSVHWLREVSSGISAPAGTTDRLFISRADASQRRILNEPAVYEALQARGFISVVLGSLSLEQQIAIIRGARIIVAPHGMGLTHLAFHQGCPTVLELYHPATGTDAYAALSRAYGFDYLYLVGNAEPGSSDFSIDVDRVIDLLSNVL